MSSPIDEFIRELDHRWDGDPGPKITLRVLGSVALMMLTDYWRGTRDGDVLETLELTPTIKGRLLALGGKGTPLAEKHHIYLDLVASGLPLLPHPPKYHEATQLNETLEHFRVEVLDVTDVVVSKLKRFNASDQKDIEEMADRGLVDRDELLKRFLAALDAAQMSAYADDFPNCVRNFHRVEREWLYTDESVIDLPGWVDDEEQGS
ncbi:MAG TPA: DUF6036 family nucleotidyltransferase [Geothrix sp.]|nr:DUF6036 family nucleotidyltransferase [Geothrix sp.]